MNTDSLLIEGRRSGICSSLEDVLARDNQTLLAELRRAADRTPVLQSVRLHALNMLSGACALFGVGCLCGALCYAEQLSFVVHTTAYLVLMCIFGAFAVLSMLRYCFAHIKLDAHLTSVSYYNACVEGNNATLNLLRYHGDIVQQPGFLTSLGGWTYAGADAQYDTYAEAVLAKAAENRIQ